MAASFRFPPTNPSTAVTIANGGRFSGGGIVQIGRSAAANGDVVLVTDPRFDLEQYHAAPGQRVRSFSQFIVSNGATAYSGSAVIGPNVNIISNSVVVTGPARCGPLAARSPSLIPAWAAPSSSPMAVSSWRRTNLSPTRLDPPVR